jgi:hypothetical protein
MDSRTIDNGERVFRFLTILFFFSNVFAQTLFSYAMSRVADPTAGRVYPLNVHGTIVYLTWWEHLLVGGWSWSLAIIFGFCWVLIAQYKKRLKPVLN